MIFVSLLLALTGCATLRDAEPEPVPDAFFPHPEGFDAGAMHGGPAMDISPTRCLQCHTPDNAEAPTCESCHELFPHVEGWRAGAVHGDGLTAADADLTPCLACHGQPGFVANETAGCTSCHAAFPHPDGWAETGHGPYVVTRGGDAAELCGACHGADLSGADTGVACASCHAQYPHSVDWALPANHGAAAQADITTCTTCHGDDFGGGNAKRACATCHAVYPHPDGWVAEHFGTVDQVGEATCMRCHSPGDGPETMPASCSQECHRP